MLPSLKIDEVNLKNKSGLCNGVLKMPEGINLMNNEELVLFSECDIYLNCVFYPSGNLYRIFKSDDENHLYNHLLKINEVKK